MEKNRRRKTKRGRSVTMLVSFFIVLFGAGAVLFFLYGKGFLKKEEQIKPAALMEQFAVQLNAGEYGQMYDMITEQSRRNISREDFISRNQNIYEGIEAAVTELTAVSEEILSEEQTVVHYHMSMDTVAGKLEFDNQATFTKNEEKKYLMEWDSNIIFPGLGSGDKVRVSTVKCSRGDITDRNGVLLAGEGIVSNVGFVPGKMPENQEEAIEMAASLLEVSPESIKKKLGASYVMEDSFVPVKMVSKDASVTKEALLQIPGIMITDAKSRTYPLEEKAAHITGYVQNINAEELEARKEKGYSAVSLLGKAGLEKIYEDRLKGTDGCEIYIAGPEGNKKQILLKREAVNGETIRLTIDAQIQRSLYEKLQDDQGCAVVMNPWTGEVLALVSAPGYDPNDFVLGMSQTKWDSLEQNPRKPLYNRFKAALCPGSSFKPVIAAMGMTAGKLDPEEDFGPSGLSWQKDGSWGGYQVTTLTRYDGPANTENALIYSDNIYFAKAALRIGKEALAKQLDAVGFGEPLPFEFELSSSVYSDDGSFQSEIQLADSGYGQGRVLVNPVHLASIYSAFLNQGKMVQPYLEYRDNPTAEFFKESAFQADAAAIIRDDLIQVVENPRGTGHLAMTEGLTLAGKTGTAEIKLTKDDENGTELGWFNAFSVAQDSERPYLVIAMAEDVKGRGGSHYVIPMVKALFE